MALALFPRFWRLPHALQMGPGFQRSKRQNRTSPSSTASRRPASLAFPSAPLATAITHPGEYAGKLSILILIPSRRQSRPAADVLFVPRHRFRVADNWRPRRIVCSCCALYFRADFLAGFLDATDARRQKPPSASFVSVSIPCLLTYPTISASRPSPVHTLDSIGVRPAFIVSASRFRVSCPRHSPGSRAAVQRPSRWLVRLGCRSRRRLPTADHLWALQSLSRLPWVIAGPRAVPTAWQEHGREFSVLAGRVE